MRDILSQRGFSDDEITSLEARDDYESIREQFESIEVELLLNHLEERADNVVGLETQDLEARWEHFKQAVRELVSERQSIQEQTGETLDEM